VLANVANNTLTAGERTLIHTHEDTLSHTHTYALQGPELGTIHQRQNHQRHKHMMDLSRIEGGGRNGDSPDSWCRKKKS